MNRVVLTLLALVAASHAHAETTTTGPLTIVPLDTAVVTTGGAPVTAINGGNRVAGGYIMTSNAAGICVSENGTAGVVSGYSGTTFTTCVAANQAYQLAPSIQSVSVNSSASSVNLTGYGLKQ